MAPQRAFYACKGSAGLAGTRVALLLSFLLFAVPALACGDGGDRPPVEVVWESATPTTTVGVGTGSVTAEPVNTIVKVTNNTGAAIRNARISLDTSRLLVPYSFSVGTVTNVSSSFEPGGVQVWSLGDLDPGASIALKLGLWFTSDTTRGLPDSIDLEVQLESEDLGAPLTSLPLTVQLAH